MTNILIRWLIFLHVLGALTFFLAHGASAAMAFKIRKERDFARIGATGAMCCAPDVPGNRARHQLHSAAASGAIRRACRACSL